MAVRIRLQRHGRKRRPFYYIVVADSRFKRDGRFIERIGDYNPLTVPASINLDSERAFHWVMEGAQPSDTVKKILSYKGILYRKHLQRGVSKGALTQEAADQKFAEWVAERESHIQDRLDKELQKIEERRQKRHKEESEKRAAKLVAKEEDAAEATAETEEASAEEATESAPAEPEAATPEAADTPAEEKTETATEEVPKEETVEAPAEEVKEETPAATEEKAEEVAETPEVQEAETKEEATEEK